MPARIVRCSVPRSTCSLISFFDFGYRFGGDDFCGAQFDVHERVDGDARIGNCGSGFWVLGAGVRVQGSGFGARAALIRTQVSPSRFSCRSGARAPRLGTGALAFGAPAAVAIEVRASRGGADPTQNLLARCRNDRRQQDRREANGFGRVEQDLASVDRPVTDPSQAPMAPFPRCAGSSRSINRKIAAGGAS